MINFDGQRYKLPDFHYDIAVIGAGPAGLTTALALKDSGLSVAVIDKSTFPREKICGDAIPGTAQKVLSSISGKYNDFFTEYEKNNFIKGYKIVAPNTEYYEVHYKGNYYNCKRIDFDYRLYRLVKSETRTVFYHNLSIQDIRRNGKVVEIRPHNKNITISAGMVVGADGAHSAVARCLKRKKTLNHNCSAVRGYFSRISGLNPELSEIHMLKNYLPGYFWIFPLKNDMANVGFGLLSDTIGEKKINLVNTFNDILKSEPAIAERFAKAQIHGPVRSYDIPMSKGFDKISGERFLLTGDAAALVDPVTGTGIGNAMSSGVIAANHIKHCFELNRFDQNQMMKYDNEIAGKIKKNLNQRFLLQKYFGTREWFLNLAIAAASRNKTLTEWIRQYV